MTTNPGIYYRQCRERIISLVTARGVDVDALVPATPLWTVRDVFAHVAGVAHDAVTGNLKGVTSDEWTAAQVERGRTMTLAELVQQWTDEGPFLDAVFAEADAPGAGTTTSLGVIDVLTHEADLRNAIGVQFSIPTDALAWAAGFLRTRFHQLVAEAGLPAVEVAASDAVWLRGRLGRLTEQQVRNLTWSLPCDPYVPIFFVFGRATHPLGEPVW